MQEIFPTRLMDATGRLYSERASLVRRSKRSSFRYSTARKSVAIAGDAARRDEVRLISLSLTCLLRRIPPGFRRETRRFILRGENSRQVPHELSRFPLHVNRRALCDWRLWRWRNAINGTLPGKEGRSGADKRQQIGVDSIGVGGVHPVREARINFQLAVRQQLVLQDGRIL